MKEGQTNDLDFNVDFSTNQGEVLSIEDFLEDPKVETKGDPITGVEEEEEQPDDKVDSKRPQVYNEDGKLVTLGEDGEYELDEEVEDPETVQEEIEEAVEQAKGSNTSFKGVLDGLIKKKLIDPIDSFEMEDGTEVPYEDKDISEEEFLQILNTRLEEERQNASKDKVSTEGVSDFTKKLIEIEKNGGNVQQALESYKNYKAPLDGLNIDDEEDQKTILYMKYHGQGLKDSEISRIVRGFNEDGLLAEKAYEAKKTIDDAFQKHLDSLNTQALEREAKQKEMLKEYRNSLGTSLNTLGVSDTIKRKILDSATKKSESGTFSLDDEYYKIRQDPEAASELAMFILYKDEFLKKISSKAKRDEAINTMKTFKLVKKGSSGINLGKHEDDDDNDDKFMLDLDKII